MKNRFIALILLLAQLALLAKEPVDYVNPYLGNISHLLVPTYPTVHLPNSMMRIYPERADFTGEKVKGLPLIVTSHRGKSAFNLSFYQGKESRLKPYFNYTYDNEHITPYSYDCRFDEVDVNTAYSPAAHAGLYTVNFEKEGTPYLILHDKDGSLQYHGKQGAISGWQEVDNGLKVYIWLEFDRKPEASLLVEKGKTPVEGTQTSGKGCAIACRFAAKVQDIAVRYGISFISADQARQNLRNEIKDFDLASLRAKGRRIWNEALGKIDVAGSDEDALTIFYTSLYRTYERMICISEGKRYFSAFDNKIHTDSEPFYTDDWIWDTYRAVHPLRALIAPEVETSMINSFIRMSQQMDRCWMPTFPEVTGDSRRMNSNHGVATVIDLYNKGIRNFDLEAAYNACKGGITEKSLCPWVGTPKGDVTDFYWQHGYMPALADGEEETSSETHGFEKRQPVAVTLGTAYDEWCLAQIAKALGKTADYDRFTADSYNYRKIFNHETAFFHPRDNKGNFIQPFDYGWSGGLGARNAYGENNGWVYRWDVPHNIADLVELMGGAEKFARNLDAMYSTPLPHGKYTFYSQLPDHTGNVGMFSMANEPSMHVPYLYNYIGQPWRTQKRIRSLLRQWFRNDLMGMPGDEDGGGMSAFVVFSMIGFYPVTPGLPMYVIGSPMFETAKVNLPGGKSFTVKARGYSPDNKYIQSATLNGAPWEQSWISHADVAAGGVLEFTMGPKPNKAWAANSIPPSMSMPQ